MPNNTPLINGKAYSWSSVTVQIFGSEIKGISAINYKESQKKENQYGIGSQPTSRMHGNVEYTGSITFEMKEIERIRDAIQSPKKSLLSIPMFPVTVTFEDNYKVVTHVLQNCEFTEDGNDLKNNEAANMTIPIIFAGIDYN